MARNRVNVAYVEADSVPLDDVRQIEITDERGDTEAQPTMTRSDRPLGYRHGQKNHSITITSLISNPREFDWHQRWRDRTVFPIAYEEEDGGQRWILGDVLITGITRGHEVNGESTEQITALALLHFPES